MAPVPAVVEGADEAVSAEEVAAVATASTSTEEAVWEEVAAVTTGATTVTAKFACAIDVGKAGIGARFSAVCGIHVSAAVRWRLVGSCCWATGPRFWFGRWAWVLELPSPMLLPA